MTRNRIEQHSQRLSSVLALVALFFNPLSVFADTSTNVTVSVDAAKVVQTVDGRVFGLNTAAWDSHLDEPETKRLVGAAGVQALRYPGGSWADGFDFTKSVFHGMPVTSQFADLCAATKSQGYIIVNYGSGTPEMAAAWVAYCNASPKSAVKIGVDEKGRDWKTAGYWAALRAALPLIADDSLNLLRASRPKPFGIRYWEIGNECYGSWEGDGHLVKHDGVVYAQFYARASGLMKSIDPTVKTGAVVTAGEDDWGSQQETVPNPVTGKLHKGWTAITLSTLNGLGVTPDFAVYHDYPEQPGQENDASLLHSSGHWISDANALRLIFNQYLGAARGSRVELDCTENNCTTFNPGKQSTSLVDGLFYADSLGSLLQTEFRALLWWDLHNGIDEKRNNSPALYGWRQYGDYGFLSSESKSLGVTENTPYPTYFAFKLGSLFARAGDKIIAAQSSSSDLAVYACHQKQGGLSLLLINKSPESAMTTKIALAGFTPQGMARTWQYGEAQDTAQSKGASVDLASGRLAEPGKTFAAQLPPYSMTVILLQKK